MPNENLTPEQQQAAMGQAYQNAYGTLVDQVWGPVFLQKLANDWGIHPQSQDEIEKLVALAHRLRAGHENELHKQAGARSSVLDQALEDVGAVLNEEGVGAQDEEFMGEAVKVASDTVAQYPHLRDAALLYQDFLAQALQG